MVEVLKSRRLKCNKYPHREKWLTANLKDREETLGQLYSKENNKDQHPDQILPTPVCGRDSQPCPSLAVCRGSLLRNRGNFSPWSGQMEALVGTHPAQAEAAPASSLLKSHEGCFNARPPGEQTAEAKATPVPVPAPGPPAALA